MSDGDADCQLTVYTGFSAWSPHEAAWASQQHGGRVPRGSFPREPGRGRIIS